MLVSILILALAKKLGVDDAAARGARIVLSASVAIADEDGTPAVSCVVAALCVLLLAAVANGCKREPAGRVDETACALGGFDEDWD